MGRPQPTKIFLISCDFSQTYPETDDANLKGTLWTFKRWLALKCECIMDFYCSPINALI